MDRNDGVVLEVDRHACSIVHDGMHHEFQREDVVWLDHDVCTIGAERCERWSHCCLAVPGIADGVAVNGNTSTRILAHRVDDVAIAAVVDEGCVNVPCCLQNLDKVWQQEVMIYFYDFGLKLIK